MNLSDLSINRPVLASVASLLIVLVGSISFLKLPVREYPDIDPPVVSITTVYPGANAKVIETDLTNILEEEINSIEGIRSLTSTSRDEVSTIVVEFELERDIDIAAQDVRDKVSRVKNKLPDEVDEPIIAKADSNSQPIMWIMVKSDTRDMIELSDYVNREIKDYFQNIRGVSKVILGGERKRAIQVLVKPQKLSYYKLSISEVQQAIQANNLELPTGRIVSETKEFTIDFSAELKNLEDYKKLIIKNTKDGKIIRLEDVADIKIGAEAERSFVRFNGQQGFGLGIIRQNKANTVEISSLIRKEIKKLKKRIPEDISLEVAYDGATFIRLSIKELYSTIAIASFLVILIIYLFLRNFRSTLIPAISIPVSLIGVMGGLQALGFTLNLMTLLGLIIAVGIVVDDSIIVLENISRYIEEGLDPIEASKKGAKEITMAVIATTLVLIAIFLPIAFMTGATGRLLSEFAFAISIAVATSSFVALTLSAALSSKLLRKTKDTGFKKYLENLFRSIENSYAEMISGLLKRKLTVFTVIISLCLPLGFTLYKICSEDFIPFEDRGAFFTIIQTQRGNNLDYMDKQIRKVEEILMSIPEIKVSISVAAFGLDAPGKVTQGIVISRLLDWSERKHVSNIIGPLYGVFGSIPDAFILPIKPSSGPSGAFGAQPIQIVIKSNDIDFLTKASAAVTQAAFSLPSIMFAKSNLSFDKPEITIKINRDKALALGVSMQEIANTLKFLYAEIDVSDFNDRGERYEVILKVPRSKKNTPSRLEELYVKSTSGNLISLANLIELKESIGPEEISHHNRKNSVTIGATPKKGFTPTDGLKELDKMTKELVLKMDNLPADLEFDYMGNSKESKDSKASIYLGFLIALLFAYLFLAAQFESFLDPLIIMLTVPLGIVGALMGLAFFKLFPLITNLAIDAGAPFYIQFIIPQFENISINIYSQIGIIMLIGMGSKNGILLVEFINQLREQGMELNEAIVKAARLRLRPILMTALSTVLGILPIALAIGVGSESRQSLGIAVCSGMIFGGFLTLFLIPCAYALLKSGRGFQRRIEPLKNNSQ
jgi:hydrophobe/amphiphile efflux-1 (HAE1) family protein